MSTWPKQREPGPARGEDQEQQGADHDLLPGRRLGARRSSTDWIEFLIKDRLWGRDDPLFPATLIEHGPERQFRAAGLARKHWSNAGPIRAIFKEAFEAAGLPAFNPHSFRHALAMLGERTCKTPEEFKAWSQNLGHEQVLTTFSSYGEVAPHRQAEIIKALGAPRGQPAELRDLVRRLAEITGEGGSGPAGRA